MKAPPSSFFFQMVRDIMEWNEEWNRSMSMTSRLRLNDGRFWDERATKVASRAFSEEMTRDQLRMIEAASGDRILEIGPGPGRLTIPMARSSSEVTVVDPSCNMLSILQERCRSHGLSNVRMVNSRWEDVDTTRIGRFDKLVSSYSLFMSDVRLQIERMNEVAKDVYLFVPAELRIPVEVQGIMFGGTRVRYTDLEILTNLLLDMGIHPKVQVMEYRMVDGYNTIEEAIEGLLDLYGADDRTMENVRNYIYKNIINIEGKYLMKGAREVGSICWRNG